MDSSSPSPPSPPEPPKSFKDANMFNLYRPMPMPNKQPSPAPLMENCFFKTLMSGVMGGGMGLVFGGLISSHDTRSAMDETLSNRQRIVLGFKEMGRASLSMGRNFAVIGVLFSGIECTIEKARARHDNYNTMAAGCATGIVLGCRGGPTAAALGCTSFTALSMAMEHVMKSMGS